MAAIITALSIGLLPLPLRGRCRASPVAMVAFEGRGRPSTPGWEAGKLDRLTDWATNNAANRPVICEYKSDSLWLWSKWRGTVLELTARTVLFTMALGVGVDVFAHEFTVEPWPVLSAPPADDPLVRQLQGLNSLWEYQLTLSTFILTFFTSEAFAQWKRVYFTTRAIQGRINDLCLFLAVGAAREGNGTTVYTEEAAELLAKCTRLLRLSHTFFWAATPTCSNGVDDGGIADGDENRGMQLRDRTDQIGPLLLSCEGLATLVAADELKSEEMEALLDSGLPPSQYAYILLEWVCMHAMEGLRSGALRGQTGWEENLLRQASGLRAEYFNIGDYTAGRMPLAYVQLVQVDCARRRGEPPHRLRISPLTVGTWATPYAFPRFPRLVPRCDLRGVSHLGCGVSHLLASAVSPRTFRLSAVACAQVLVDSLVVLAPVGLYADLGTLSILGAGTFALFFKGLLELSKSFLDPFGNEGYPGQNIRVDVLVSELNFGAASRWVLGGALLPAGTSAPGTSAPPTAGDAPVRASPTL